MSVASVGDNISDCYLDSGLLYPGGNAVNVAVAVARAGGSASYIGAVGDDDRGRLLRESLIAEGVDVGGLRTCNGDTAMAVVRHVDGERVFGGFDRGVAQFGLEAADLDRIAEHSIVHTTYCSGLEGELPRMAERARVSYDFDTRVGDGYADGLLESVWLAAFSATHLDEADCRALLRWAQDRGAEFVLATRGARGALLGHRSEVFRAVAAPVSVVDTLGAGDVCIGRLLHELDAGHQPEDALAAAVDAATAACRYHGGFGHGTPLTAHDREHALSFTQ